MKKEAGVIVFPGTNCDRDAIYAFKHNGMKNITTLWYDESDLSKFKLLILPGGFSFGDFLRTGAICVHSSVFRSLDKFLQNGGYIIGICNGFQMLVEAHLLPGFLVRNTSNLFISKMVNVKVIRNDTAFTSEYKKGDIIKVPIAHTTGNYQPINAKNIEKQMIFQYTDENGKANKLSNPNGSYKNIAGIVSKNGRILGMMPHFERVSDDLLGDHGIPMLNSIKKNIMGV
ncbi:phosphoribosylformylglycinamidine synthase I [bacterium]|nr:phosphoribosylformylglycinamidine synthase I [bacterium]